MFVHVESHTTHDLNGADAAITRKCSMKLMISYESSAVPSHFTRIKDSWPVKSHPRRTSEKKKTSTNSFLNICGIDKTISFFLSHWEDEESPPECFSFHAGKLVLDFGFMTQDSTFGWCVWVEGIFGGGYLVFPSASELRFLLI